MFIVDIHILSGELFTQTCSLPLVIVKDCPLSASECKMLLYHSTAML